MDEITSRRLVPMRVDFAGGWLDVPRLAIKGGFIVNCAIVPGLLQHNYHQGGGLGGSAAAAIAEGRDAESEELLKAGWQDAAVIRETGLCVWRSGPRPVLDAKLNPDWIQGKMVLLWMGKEHKTESLVNIPRNYTSIYREAIRAREAVLDQDLGLLSKAILGSYDIQLDEGMASLPEAHYSIAKKYCGSGHGGYALYLFSEDKHRQWFFEENGDALMIEPYME